MSKKAYIKHIMSYFPEAYEDNPAEERITQKVGVFRRHIAAEGECASDLCIKAAEDMFEKYNVDKETIDAVIFCTETPDYIMPSTACVIHGRLGLKQNCMAFDFNHGCTGYIYGLALAKSVIETGLATNVLLLAGDTLSKIIHPKDMRTKPLFGDSGSATLVSGTYSRREFLSNFRFGTNGEEFRKIIVHYGGMRMKHVDPAIAHEEIVDQYGNVRTDATLYMDGKAVVQFTQTVVPPMMHDILDSARLNMDDITNFVFHQANKFMLQNVQKACKIPDDGRYFNDCSMIGNTASASIPNAINKMQRDDIVLGKYGLLMGFGIGLTWGGCIADLSMIDPEN